MGYLRHVRALNTFQARDFRPFYIDGIRYGRVRPAFAEALRDWPKTFHVATDRVDLAPGLADPENRSAALTDAVEGLAARGLIGPLRGEAYAVVNRWGERRVMTVDRAAMAAFGFRSFGVHVNGACGSGGGARTGRSVRKSSTT